MGTQIECYNEDPYYTELRAPSGCRQWYTEKEGNVKSYNQDGKTVYFSSKDYLYCIRRDPEDCQITWKRSAKAPAFSTAVGVMHYTQEDQNKVAFNCYTDDDQKTNGNNACGSSIYGCLDVRADKKRADYIQIPEGRFTTDGTGPAVSGKYKQNDIYCGAGVGWDSDATPGIATSATDGVDTGLGVISQAAGDFTLRFHAASFVPDNIPQQIDDGTGTMVTINNYDKLVKKRLGMNLDYEKSETCEPNFLVETDLLPDVAASGNLRATPLQVEPVVAEIETDEAVISLVDQVLQESTITDLQLDVSSVLDEIQTLKRLISGWQNDSSEDAITSSPSQFSL